MGDITEIPKDKLYLLAEQAEVREVAAIQPAYDLDRLTLAQERRVLLKGGQIKSVVSNIEKVQIFIPDANGGYQEENSVQYQILFQQNYKTVVFPLNEYTHKFPLRFDPCESSAIIDIMSITAFDQANNRTIWEVSYHNRDVLVAAGNATMPTAVQDKVGSLATANVTIIDTLSRLGRRALLSWRSGIRHIKKIIPLELKVRVKHALFGPDVVQEPVAIRIISNGSDPQIYLPRISDEIGFPLLITIQMKVTPVVC
jgi:hypothetical protein